MIIFDILDVLCIICLLLCICVNLCLVSYNCCCVVLFSSLLFAFLSTLKSPAVLVALTPTAALYSSSISISIFLLRMCKQARRGSSLSFSFLFDLNICKICEDNWHNYRQFTLHPMFPNIIVKCYSCIPVFAKLSTNRLNGTWSYVFKVCLTHVAGSKSFDL